MQRESPKENTFVWSSGGIRQEAAEPSPPVSPAPRPSPAPESGSVEMRRYPRLDLKLPILYKVMGDDASRIPASVRPSLMAESANVSPIGLCLDLEEELAPGVLLALSIHLINRRQRFEALGRVVWSRPSEVSGHFLTGLQFVVADKRGVKEHRHAEMAALVRLLGGG